MQSVLSEIDRLGCRRVLSLGDVAGYYCMLNECIEELSTRQIENVLGNHDSYVISDTDCPRSNSANDCLDYQRQTLTPESRAWLGKSSPGPITHLIESGTASFVHGGWHDPVDEYMYRLSPEYFRGRPEKFFFSGHTHVQILATLGDKLYCNPGSVGQPRDGDPRAAFAILQEDGTIDLHRIKYDIDSMAGAMRSAGFDQRFYENLYSGLRIGGQGSHVTIVP